jgi:hypothetical protein
MAGSSCCNDRAGLRHSQLSQYRRLTLCSATGSPQRDVPALPENKKATEKFPWLWI